jgi:hypothetical protein
MKKELSEKNFISDNPHFIQTLKPFLISFTLFFLLLLLVGGAIQIIQRGRQQIERSQPFLEVTNRDMSLFLWQFPGFMRVHVKQKTGYMPGFRYVESQTVDPAQADSFVVAPPDVLFLYHTWKRLLSHYFIPRSIPAKEFIEFLKKDSQWDPANWSQTTSEYIHFVVTLPNYDPKEDLSTLSENILPIVVRKAFQGWKNYYKEGDQINSVHPTQEGIKNFLKKYPHYNRNYWVGIGEVEGVSIGGFNYLLDLINPSDFPTELIPENQMSGFLKVAYYNDQQSSKSK